MESFKKDLDSDRTSLMRRIVGKLIPVALGSTEHRQLAKPFLCDDTNETKSLSENCLTA